MKLHDNYMVYGSRIELRQNSQWGRSHQTTSSYVSFIVTRVCLLTLTPKLIRIIFRIQTLSGLRDFKRYRSQLVVTPFPFSLPSRVTTHSLLQTEKRDL